MAGTAKWKMIKRKGIDRENITLKYYVNTLRRQTFLHRFFEIEVMLCRLKFHIHCFQVFASSSANHRSFRRSQPTTYYVLI